MGAFWRIVLLGTLLTGMAQAETFLLMAEEEGCSWCARWNAEIGPIYPKTAEGQNAPLRRFDLRKGQPDYIALKSAVRFTPTFILVKETEEIARIEGYPGEELFWWQLSVMLKRSGPQEQQKGNDQ
nr:thioredoxin family protein [Palleronia caenipelagi]